jgi:hypothetical protein
MNILKNAASSSQNGRQEWQPGDLPMWVSRSVMHYREPFDPNARRRLRPIVQKDTASPVGPVNASDALQEAGLSVFDFI